MKSAEDIESYLLHMGVVHETVKPGIWLVKVDGQTSGDLDRRPGGRVPPQGHGPAADGREELFRTLLRLNTTEMVHGAFGIEGDAVVIVHALELENLDFNEFQAVIDDMSMAVRKHRPHFDRHVGPTGANRRRSLEEQPWESFRGSARSSSRT